MKSYGFFIVVLVSLSIFGCADKDAYSKFNLTKAQEIAFDNVTLAKITDKGETDGVFSALYLNEIYPKRYDNDTFYVIFYLKQKERLNDFNITLNEQEPLEVKKLPPNNDYTNLLDIKNDWSHYYLIEFDRSDAKNLKLQIELKNGAKASVDFEKTL